MLDYVAREAQAAVAALDGELRPLDPRVRCIDRPGTVEPLLEVDDLDLSSALALLQIADRRLEKRTRRSGRQRLVREPKAGVAVFYTRREKRQQHVTELVGGRVEVT